MPLPWHELYKTTSAMHAAHTPTHTHSRTSESSQACSAETMQAYLADTTQTWSTDSIAALYELPFQDLLYKAQTIHRQHHVPNTVQMSTLLSIKTGGCPEDCAYCPQSARYHTEVEKEQLMQLPDVLAAARAAKEGGAQRFCMGAAWRSPKAHHIEAIAEMIGEIKKLGMETCVTLGMLKDGQAEALKDAGLDYYNHNLDTSPEFYGSIISTRTYQDRLDTLARVRGAGIHVCCGGIVGLGESRQHRAALIAQLANMNPYPESVPVNSLVQVEGTPLHGIDPLDPFEFVRTIAITRITMPKTVVRLSAGREAMGDAVQALCFLAGANSIFLGDKLLTTANAQQDDDYKLLERLGIAPVHTSHAGPASIK